MSQFIFRAKSAEKQVQWLKTKANTEYFDLSSATTNGSIVTFLKVILGKKINRVPCGTLDYVTVHFLHIDHKS